MLKNAIRALVRPLGYQINRIPPPEQDPDVSLYREDGLTSWHQHDFMQDPAFMAAYAVGRQAMGEAYHAMHWRAHVIAWAGRQALAREGDFVECGVSHGFMSSILMTLLDWDRHGRTFWLFDTFQGADPRFVSEPEKAAGLMQRNASRITSGEYATNLEKVEATFAPWQRKRLVVGAVPETLAVVADIRVAFLHIDMNCAPPERAAIEFFWDRLSPGALVVLDDYGWRDYLPQKLSMDEFAASKGIEILRLPTGQGLIIRP
ncbi:MAG: TylF/MycF/NovP-related O-methyltransferase [Pseudomonadota bacterium]